MMIRVLKDKKQIKKPLVLWPDPSFYKRKEYDTRYIAFDKVEYFLAES